MLRTTTSAAFGRLATTAVQRGAAPKQMSRVLSPAISTMLRTSSFSSSSSSAQPPSYPVIPKLDFGQYQEYSVIHTDRSLNLMSDPFGNVMRNLNDLLKYTYNADAVSIIPGSGTFGMEAVARQFAHDEHVMVLRNGWFSYRWTEIFEMGNIPKSHTVLKAIPTPTSTNDDQHMHYRPVPIEQVVEQIEKERPSVFFCPHVETSTGMILPDEYIQKIGQAVHSYGGLLVVDCIASGTVWLDMEHLGVDVLISAPQKGWTGPPCAALVMMSESAVNKMRETKESSFSISLKRWTAIMEAYEKGGFAYHTTMPTDALRDFHEISVETLDIGLPELKNMQLDMGQRARSILDQRGLTSIAAPGFQAPGVLVYYSPSETSNPEMMQAFHKVGLQIAMGVPWKIDEPTLKTFRIGLFGLDKLTNMERTLSTMEEALDQVLVSTSTSTTDKAA